jgi:hypothetical protein
LVPVEGIEGYAEPPGFSAIRRCKRVLRAVRSVVEHARDGAHEAARQIERER